MPAIGLDGDGALAEEHPGVDGALHRDGREIGPVAVHEAPALVGPVDLEVEQVLLERLWDSGGNFIDDHTLTVTMNRLRAKIEDDTHPYIKTVRGMGYIWTGGKP